MNREIKFRGISEGKWYYGLLTFMFDSYAIVNPKDENTVHLIDEKTVAQYTGLKDKNGVEIYEGDRCKFYGRFGIDLGVVKFERHGFAICLESGYMYKIDEFWLEVIGNIYENPELLEVEG